MTMLIETLDAQSQVGFPILSVTLLLPVLAALLIGFVQDQKRARQVAVGSSLAVLALTLMTTQVFTPGSAQLQMVETLNWLPSMGIHYRLGVDGLSILFLPLTALIFTAVFVAAADTKVYSRVFLIHLLLLEASTIGIYASIDLMLFFCFFELALVPSFWLIKVWGVGPDRQAAASKYLVYMLLGSLPLMVGFILLALNHASADAAAGGAGLMSFDLVALLRTPVPPESQTLIFALMAIGFAVKGPALPFHTWMPTAVTEGPISVGVYLVGLKLGAYGFLRFVLPLTPDASREFADWVIAVELFAILYAGLIALTQFNLRRLIVFASISHFGLIMVAAFSMNEQAWQGSLLLMFNAGLGTAGLLIVAGFLQRRLGSTDLLALGGLARKVPQLATVAFVAGLALIGVPGTSGFSGELMAMSGAYQAHWSYGAIAALGVVLSAGYFLWFFQRAFMGPVRHAAIARMSDLNRAESLVSIGLIALILVVGFFPRPLTRLTEASVVAMTSHVRAGVAPAAPAAPAEGGGGEAPTDMSAAPEAVTEQPAEFSPSAVLGGTPQAAEAQASTQ